VPPATLAGSSVQVPFWHSTRLSANPGCSRDHLRCTRFRSASAP